MVRAWVASTQPNAAARQIQPLTLILSPSSRGEATRAPSWTDPDFERLRNMMSSAAKSGNPVAQLDGNFARRLDGVCPERSRRTSTGFQRTEQSNRAKSGADVSLSRTKQTISSRSASQARVHVLTPRRCFTQD